MLGPLMITLKVYMYLLTLVRKAYLINGYLEVVVQHQTGNDTFLQGQKGRKRLNHAQVNCVYCVWLQYYVKFLQQLTSFILFLPIHSSFYNIQVWIGISRYRKMLRYYNDLYDNARQDKACKIIQEKAAVNNNAIISIRLSQQPKI